MDKRLWDECLIPTLYGPQLQRRPPPHHCWQRAPPGARPLGEGGSPGCSWKARRLISKKPAEGQEGLGKALSSGWLSLSVSLGRRGVGAQGTRLGGEGMAGMASQDPVVAQPHFRTWTSLEPREVLRGLAHRHESQAGAAGAKGQALGVATNASPSLTCPLVYTCP